MSRSISPKSPRKKIAECTRRIDRVINAVADGGGTFADFRGRLNDSRSLRAQLQEELDSLESERLIALHPRITVDYRREVEALNRALEENQTPEAREDAIPRLRALIDAIVLTPSDQGRGVAIEMTGRLANMIELATGKPTTRTGMLTLERVKGIEPSS